MWSDREKAGRQLAVRLRHLKKLDPLVLALPRGGVPVARAVAAALQADFDLLLVRKLGVPWHPELAMGAVSDGAHPRTIINWRIVEQGHISEADIQVTAAREIAELERRRNLWLSGQTHIPIRDRVIIIIDDGVATGASIRAALEVARHAGARRLVLAVPVAAMEAAETLKADCDEAIFLMTPDDFRAVGDYYEDFHQLDDAEVGRMVQAAGMTPH
jgi:putative phosphoribosyl transferase